MGRWIEAKRDGRCAHCGSALIAGTDIWYKSAGVAYCQKCGLVDEVAPPAVGPMEESVLKELNRLPVEAGEGLLAQSMLSLARDLDNGDVPPRERPVYTKELRIGFLTLKDEFPASEEDDETDEARKKRERRAREGNGY